MERDQGDKPPLGGDDPGRSGERAAQDRLLEREAHRESWLARLWRHRRHATGRPHPGKGAGDDAGPTRR